MHTRFPCLCMRHEKAAGGADKYLLLASGLGVGGKSSMLPLKLLVDFLCGHLGGGKVRRTSVGVGDSSGRSAILPSEAEWYQKGEGVTESTALECNHDHGPLQWEIRHTLCLI